MDFTDRGRTGSAAWWHRQKNEYGPFRDRVLFLRVLILRFGAQMVRSVVGYNFPSLFLGLRGGFEVTLKVFGISPVRRVWIWKGEESITHRADQLVKWGSSWASLLGGMENISPVLRL